MSQRGLPRDWKRRLVAALVEPDVERILLFGSRARGDAGAHSDLDLLIVRCTEQRFLERIGAIYDRLAGAALRLNVDVDVLVYTPAEYERMLADENPLVTRATSEGKVLYERSVSRSRTLVSTG
jgi:predicted nucleotidyltransferase